MFLIFTIVAAGFAVALIVLVIRKLSSGSVGRGPFQDTGADSYGIMSTSSSDPAFYSVHHASHSTSSHDSGAVFDTTTTSSGAGDSTGGFDGGAGDCGGGGGDCGGGGDSGG